MKSKLPNTNSLFHDMIRLDKWKVEYGDDIQIKYCERQQSKEE